MMNSNKEYEYLMSDNELDLVFQFKTIFRMNSIEYYSMKSRFFKGTLQDRVQYYKLNKIFHIIIEFFEKEILCYGGFEQCSEDNLPFEKGLNLNVLTDWFYDRILLVILLYLTTTKNNTVLLLRKNGWQNMLSYGHDLKNISIDSMRISSECSTSFRVILHY